MGRRPSAGWADYSWNGVRGCSKVSAGCDNCPAEQQALKNPQVLGKWGTATEGGRRVVGTDSYWNEPMRWDREARAEGIRARVLTPSMGDWFEQWAGPLLDTHGFQIYLTPTGTWTTKQNGTPPRGVDWEPLTLDHCLERFLALVARTPWLTWMFVTRRPEAVPATLRRVEKLRIGNAAMIGGDVAGLWADGKPPDNVWMGVGVEDQETLVRRAYHLGDIAARLRFVVAEPLLGPIDLAPFFARDKRPLSDAFNWLVVGGEAGDPGKVRRLPLAWLRAVLAQTREYSLPAYVSRLGTTWVDADGHATTTSDRGENIDLWPRDVQVLDFPDLEE